MSPRRTLICTFTALTSGIFGAYMGGQLSLATQNRTCETQFWGPKLVCQAASAPGAMWRGSLTGVWTGAVLGAFVAGLATRKVPASPTLIIHPSHQPVQSATEGASVVPAITSEPATLATPAALTSLQTEVLYCLLALLTTKQISSETPRAEAELDTTIASPNLVELKTWAEDIARSQPDTYDVTQLPSLQSVTVDEAQHLLVEAGFSVQAVDQAWQLLQASGQMPPQA
ncbi:hypothetical protein [Trichocoleus sp. FACHB-591]|uniref:hypothetical protein n=1 Tax=Trichocoleus sp. FACHB-591 TaxID=2692872 RepID=UPI0018EF9712|nr:hypothetical protein [Trichocoleus sp. FACHB-591]